jgi:hypothetical protein
MPLRPPSLTKAQHLLSSTHTPAEGRTIRWTLTAAASKPPSPAAPYQLPTPWSAIPTQLLLAVQVCGPSTRCLELLPPPKAVLPACQRGTPTRVHCTAVEGIHSSATNCFTLTPLQPSRARSGLSHHLLLLLGCSTYTYAGDAGQWVAPRRVWLSPLLQSHTLPSWGPATS